MTLYLQDADFTLLCGDALEELRTLPDGSVHCALTSPPFFGLRDYGTGSWEGGDADHEHDTVGARGGKGGSGTLDKRSGDAQVSRVPVDVCSCGARRVDQQIGLEATPDEWVARLVSVFREVRRVLRDDGTLWVECGDSYSASPPGNKGTPDEAYKSSGLAGAVAGSRYMETLANSVGQKPDTSKLPGTKPKDLLGQPWLLAFALRADGWYLRQCIIWSKPNAMPESVRDRCTTAHSYVFLFSKKPRYFFDSEAIAEPAEWARWGDQTVPKYEGTETASGWMQPKTRPSKKPDGWDTGPGGHGTIHRNGREKGEAAELPVKGSKNARSVWQIPTSGFSEAHFATWPPALVERIIRAGTSERGVCPVCGAPWVREIEQGPPPPEPAHRSPAKRLEPGQAGNVGEGNMGFRASRLSGQEMQRWKAAHPDVTLGWKPSCDHGLDPIPATILDCFMGSGTSALVARKLGRRSIGIELNESYCEMAARRLQQLSLLA